MYALSVPAPKGGCVLTATRFRKYKLIKSSLSTADNTRSLIVRMVIVHAHTYNVRRLDYFYHSHNAKTYTQLSLVKIFQVYTLSSITVNR